MNEPSFDSNLKHQPPSNVDMEGQILGCLLFDQNSIEKVIEILDPKYFYLKSHRIICQCILTLYKKQLPIDFQNLSDLLITGGNVDKLPNGLAYLTQIIDGVISTSVLKSYLDSVIEKYYRRKLIEAGQKIQEFAFDTRMSTELLLDTCQQEIFSVTQLPIQKSGMKHISTVLADLIADIDQQMNHQNTEKTISTGFSHFNHLLGGLRRGSILVLAARPSFGKTTLAINLCVNVAKQGFPVAIFSLEMKAKELVNKILSSTTGINGKRLEKGHITESEQEEIIKATGNLTDLNLHLFDEFSLTEVSTIASHCRTLQSESKQQLGLVMIDYAQLMINGDNENLELSKISRAIKKMATDISCPVLLLSQLNRGLGNRQDKQPKMSDLRSSGALEQDASVVALLYRDEFYNEDSPSKGLVQVDIAKNRHGSTGKFELIFRKEISLFQNFRLKN